MSVNLLYIQNCIRNKHNTIDYHSHDFFQIEIVTEGNFLVFLSNEKFLLEAGNILLIHPHEKHKFIYDKKPTSWISLKFFTNDDLSNFENNIIKNSLFTSRLITSFETIIHGNNLENFEKKLVEGHIESLICYLQSYALNDQHNKTNIIDNIINYINNKNGKPITINELALKFPYTRSHLSKIFKKSTGETLKTYIDKTRLKKSKQMLLYSDLSISDIADELGFNDIFSFSRFFKKHSLICPKEYRKRNWLS